MASVYDAAVEAGLSERAQKIFDRLGTSNFEGVMRALSDAYWIAETYGIPKESIKEILDDVEVVKRTLVQAVAQSHLAHSGEVPDEKKTCALAFFRDYTGIFTTNYDLLVYWVVMHEGESPSFKDGFRSDPDVPEAPYLIFAERMGRSPAIYYLHGALHLHIHRGQLRKHSWVRTGKRLTDLIQEGLGNQSYPLFVAEGSAEQKLEQIERTGYLWYCLDKLRRIESPLVTFGHALGHSDQHIVEAIARNIEMPHLYVGIRGTLEDQDNLPIRTSTARMKTIREQFRQAGKKVVGKELNISFYDADTAPVWVSGGAA